MTEVEVNNRKAFATKLQPATVEKVIGALDLNPYSVFFRSLRTVPNLDTFAIELKANPRMGDSTYSAPMANQVAALSSDTADGTNSCEHDIIVHQHNGYQQQIRYRYGCYDALQYPLLFPRGEPGWHQGTQIAVLNLGPRREFLVTEHLAKNALNQTQLIVDFKSQTTPSQTVATNKHMLSFIVLS